MGHPITKHAPFHNFAHLSSHSPPKQPDVNNNVLSLLYLLFNFCHPNFILPSCSSPKIPFDVNVNIHEMYCLAQHEQTFLDGCVSLGSSKINIQHNKCWIPSAFWVFGWLTRTIFVICSWMQFCMQLSTIHALPSLHSLEHFGYNVVPEYDLSALMVYHIHKKDLGLNHTQTCHWLSCTNSNPRSHKGKCPAKCNKPPIFELENNYWVRSSFLVN
jgi:hypothetical protein